MMRWWWGLFACNRSSPDDLGKWPHLIPIQLKCLRFIAVFGWSSLIDVRIWNVYYHYCRFIGQGSAGETGNETSQRRGWFVPQVRPPTRRGGIEIQRRISGIHHLLFLIEWITIHWLRSFLIDKWTGRVGEGTGQADVALRSRAGRQEEEGRGRQSVDATAEEGTRRPGEEPHHPPRQEEGIAHPKTPRARTVIHSVIIKQFIWSLFSI